MNGLLEHANDYKFITGVASKKEVANLRKTLKFFLKEKEFLYKLRVEKRLFGKNYHLRKSEEIKEQLEHDVAKAEKAEGKKTMNFARAGKKRKIDEISNDLATELECVP